MNKKPFEGLKLVEFTWGGVGPFVGNFLTYFGATTIRVESKARPDVTRGFQGPGDNPKDGGELERGPVFALTHPTKSTVSA
jgi:crotonobetainyl-CoA:carnitine CoA-transferase CaiB-like acyl-CoA transferase